MFPFQEYSGDFTGINLIITQNISERHNLIDFLLNKINKKFIVKYFYKSNTLEGENIIETINKKKLRFKDSVILTNTSKANEFSKQYVKTMIKKHNTPIFIFDVTSSDRFLKKLNHELDYLRIFISPLELQYLKKIDFYALPFSKKMIQFQTNNYNDWIVINNKRVLPIYRYNKLNIFSNYIQVETIRKEVEIDDTEYNYDNPIIYKTYDEFNILSFI